jgi:serine/threonine protein kinase
MPTLESNKASISPSHSEVQPAASYAFSPGTVLSGRYRIVSLLGRGGMGEVYRAEDLKLGNAVALKFLAPSLQNDSEALAQLHREVLNARQVSHPCVCRVFDIGEMDGRNFLTMEYIDGEDFASLLRRIGRLPADKALEATHQLCAGLAAAHEAGLLHRDLKPGNIMLDARGRVRITDFGLAVKAHASQGRREFAGTPAYMAPEQITKGETSVSSDIYSLGLVLYELFTGRLPFDMTAQDTWRRMHVEVSPRAPSSVVKEIDPLVENTILLCLQKDPARRPASVQEVADALPKSDRPVPGVGASTPHRSPEPSPRHSAKRASPSTRTQESAAGPATLAQGRPRAFAWAAAAATLVALLTATYFFWIGNRPPPFSKHFTIERATDSDQVQSTAISPDGKYLATVVRNAKGDQSLWVHDFPTRSDRAILENAQFKYKDLIFSPDASYLYFRVPSLGTARSDQDDLYRLPVLGGQPSLITQNVDGAISFIDGGGRICVYRQNETAGGSYQFISANADGSDEQILTDVKASLIQVPACSPDARRAAFFQYGTSSLNILDFATRSTRVLWTGKSGHYLGDLRWEIHGKGVFATAVSESRFRGQLSFISYPGHEMHEITNDLDDYRGISLTADARTLVTTQKEENNRFAEVPLGDPTSMREHPLPGMAWFTWLDNDRIAGSGTDSVLKVADLRKDEVSTVNVDKNHIFLYPSRCGEQTVIVSGNTVDGSDPGLFRIRLDGSMAVQLTHRARQFLPACTSDGKWLFYADTMGSNQFIVRLPFKNGALDEVGAKKAADGFSWFDLSPDGKMLAVGVESSPGDKSLPEETARGQGELALSIVSTETLQPIKTFPRSTGVFGQIAFAADNRVVYYTTYTDAGSTIWKQPLDAARERLMDFPGKTILYLRASPDGSRLGMLIDNPRSHAVVLREDK